MLPALECAAEAISTPNDKGARRFLNFRFFDFIVFSGFWFLVSGFWFLGSGFWVLGSEFWALVLDSGEAITLSPKGSKQNLTIFLTGVNPPKKLQKNCPRARRAMIRDVRRQRQTEHEDG